MFVPGHIMRRRDLHLLYGGQEQGGISTPANHLFIMLFTAPSGLSHGYDDGWTETGIFLYSGEGQIGDMSFVRGNRALRDHLQDGKDVFLFEYVDRGLVRYVGQMIVTGYHERQGRDSAANQRHTIVFELVPVEDTLYQATTPAELEDPLLRNLSANELQRIAETPSAADMTPTTRKESLRKRSQALHEYVLCRANGVCEGCGNKAPFMSDRGIPYLEVHYLRRSSDVGPESPSWVAALCPNCRRQVHRGSDAAQYNQQIIGSIAAR